MARAILAPLAVGLTILLMASLAGIGATELLVLLALIVPGVVFFARRRVLAVRSESTAG